MAAWSLLSEQNLPDFGTIWMLFAANEEGT